MSTGRRGTCCIPKSFDSATANISCDMLQERDSNNSTNSTIVGWVAESNNRGTLSLVLSCLTTLMLCTYSAIHLNVPGKRETNTGFIRRHLKWTFLGIFGPELVIWAAWRQYVSAKSLQYELEHMCSVNAAKRPSQSSSDTQKPELWTLTHCFYAGMGGFVIDDDDGDDDQVSYIPQNTRLTLTPRGIQLLARCGMLPRISREEIIDKSKTDWIGKTVAILQGSWMVLQTISRVTQSLPVTMLEINTLGHVLCAIITYLLWWHKPRCVQEPTRLQGQNFKPLLAFMYMSSQISDINDSRDPIHGPLLRDFGAVPEISYLAFQMSALPSDLDLESTSRESDSSLHRVTSLGTGKFVVANPCQDCGFKARSDIEEWAGMLTGDGNELRALRWNLAATAIAEYPALKQRLSNHADPELQKMQQALRLYPEMPEHIQRKYRQKLFCLENADGHRALRRCDASDMFHCDSEQLVTSSASNWPADDLLRGFPGIFMGATLWFASIGYGLVHLAAWRSFFPTEIESLLWKCSASNLVASGLIWIAINSVSALSSTVWWYWYDVLAGNVSRAQYTVLAILCTLGGLMYGFSRLYLVVEAFTTLRSLPYSAYVSPGWIVAIPHL